MPAKDTYHEVVKTALIKDGWTIVADPYTIRYEDVDLFADLAAEKLIAAERQGKKIVVEIKSFLSSSPLRDFQQALGQYILYRNFISLTEPEYQLYLAIKESTYENLFERKALKVATDLNQMNLLVFDIVNEEILQWISSNPIEK